MFFGYNPHRNRIQYSEDSKKLIDLIKENDQESLASYAYEGKATSSNFYIEANISKYVQNNFNNNFNNNNNDRIDEREDNLINDRITLLHAAAYYDSLECFCYLHQTEKADLRVKSVRSFYPLHYACFNGSKEVTAYILHEDPGQVQLVNNNSFLCFAVHGGSSQILEELFRKGAKTKKTTNKIDDPIDKAISYDNYKCCEVLMRYSEYYSSDFTPAMIAAQMVNSDLLGYLVKDQSDLEFSDRVQKSVFSLIFDISNGEKFRDLIIKWLTTYDELQIEPPSKIQCNGVCHWICKIADPDAAKIMARTRNVNLNRIGLGNHLGPYFLANKNHISDQEIITILNILISNGFDINYQPEFGFCEPVLKCFLRTIKIRYDVIEFLVANDADPNLPWSEDKKTTILSDVKKRKNDKRLMKIFEKYL